MSDLHDLENLETMATALVDAIIAHNLRPVISIDENGITIEGHQDGKISRWIYEKGADGGPGRWICGNCGYSAKAGRKYCPDCGAEMRATVL